MNAMPAQTAIQMSFIIRSLSFRRSSSQGMFYASAALLAALSLIRFSLKVLSRSISRAKVSEDGVDTYYVYMGHDQYYELTGTRASTHHRYLRAQGGPLKLLTMQLGRDL